MKRTLISLAVILSLSGCGGGGGGSRPGVLNFGTPVLLTTIDPSVISLPSSPLINDLFSRDINADGADEVIMANWLSQPTVQHSDTRVSVFGFNTGRFADETNRWFEPGQNTVTGTATVLFGNFTGHRDGKLDVMVAVGTDSSVTGSNVLFRNTGNDRFSRIELSNNVWLHGGAVGDINSDGIDDIVTIGYGWPGSNLILGGSNPTTRNINLSGSDVTLGRFQLAGPSDTHVYAAVVDDSSNKHFKFYSIDANGAVTNVAVTIPDPDLGDNSHDVRVRTINLDSDGLPDLLVVSRPWAGANGAWDDSTRRMRVQFYRNLGNGEFAKDRDSFVRDGVTWHNPVVRDINADGVDDILLNSMTGGTTLLLGARDPATGRIIYTEAGSDIFRAFENNLVGFQRPVTIVRGPNGRNYLVGAQADNANRVHIFYSEIGNQGVYTVDSVITTLRQSWPWLTDAEIKQILIRTGTSFQDGTIINVSQALRPAGGIFIPTPQGIKMLQGSFSGLKINGTSLQIVDGFGRNYVTRAEFMDQKQDLSPWKSPSYDQVNWFGYNKRTVVGIVAADQGWWSGHNPKTGDLAIGKSFQTEIGDIDIAGLQQKQNPWVKLSGIWGTTNRSFTTEISWAKRQNSLNVGSGLMLTSVDLKPGLVTKLSRIIGFWTEVQYQLNDSWQLASGIDPTVIWGRAEVQLPTSVTALGEVKFSRQQVGFESSPNTYTRLSFRHKIPTLSNSTLTFVARTSQDRNHRVSLLFNKEF